MDTRKAQDIEQAGAEPVDETNGESVNIDIRILGNQVVVNFDRPIHSLTLTSKQAVNMSKILADASGRVSGRYPKRKRRRKSYGAN